MPTRPHNDQAKRVATRFQTLPMFVERWSPRSFSSRPLEPETLCSMFEAARLAPSAHNTQPARFLLTHKRSGDAYSRLLDCLSDGNRKWAHTAPVLVLAAVMRQRFSQDAVALVPYPHSMHDLGLAVMSLILQGHALGVFCHPMAGFDPDKARDAFAIPPLFEAGVVVAMGYRGSPDELPEELQPRERAPRSRRPLEELVFEQTWGQAAAMLAC